MAGIGESADISPSLLMVKPGSSLEGPPNIDLYSTIDFILVGSVGPFSVYPIKAGIAVSTGTTEGGNSEISSM